MGRWGDRIGRTVDPPVVIALRGSLGAGKSVLARAIGRGAGVADPMPSPSYNLLLRYTTPDGRVVSHLDLYRIESSEEVWELGWSQLGTEGDVVLVEWPERAEDLMPPDYWLISLDTPEDHPLLRDVEVQRVGQPPELPGFPMSVSAPG
ncbi:MAG: tRNA (adenosine(37)-N6)-threonylcarbamoyltransferase complex ATPase subunit type 1 TsaE [Longimicrobiales bacterium]